MAQAPTTVLQEINALYVALYDRAADNQGINYWCAQVGLTAAQAATTPVTTAQATLLGQQFVSTQATYFNATYGNLNDLQYVQALYGNIGGNAGDATGVQYWFSALTTLESQAGQTQQSARAAIAGQFVDAMLGLDLTVGAAALGLSASDYAAAQARQAELLNKVSVSQFYANELVLPGGSILTVTSNAPAPGNVPLQAAIDAVAGVTNDPATVAQTEAAVVAAVAAGNLNPILALATSTVQQTETLTLNQDTFVTHGLTIFNAPLVGGVATLGSFDSLVNLPAMVPPGSSPIPSAPSVLNAFFSGTPSPQQPGSLNIQGIPNWNINQDLGGSGSFGSGLTGSGDPFYNNSSVISLTGDATGGSDIISGLLHLSFEDDETNGSLFIGDNASPVYEPNGLAGFSIKVSDAVGTGFNGVDVDIAASAFTGKDTIHVTANVVGLFPEQNGSYVIPPPILGETGDPDSYNPNWDGYGADAFAISAGASSSSLTTLNGVATPPSGAVGFQNWVIASTGAAAVGGLNILALGNEGSWNASSLTMTDDGSNTMLFGSYISDSLQTDWQNLATIDFTGTSGFVTLTGAEVFAVGSSLTGGFFGLMTADTSALTSIKGGTGNSFYDLSSLTLTAAHAATLLQGGTGTKGNSEIAFNNNVIASVSTTNPLGLSVAISNVQILDDTGNTGSGINTQGGAINMADFAGTSSATVPTGLQGLNQPYALISEPNPPATLVPYGLPYTSTAQANLDGPGGTTSNDVVPAGYQLLQLLDADGSTASTLTSDLNIYNGPSNFAINMQDMADGNLAQLITDGGTNQFGASDNELVRLSGYNITIVGESVVPAVQATDHLKVWVSDDGATLQNLAPETGIITTVTETVSIQTGPSTTVAITQTVAITTPGTAATTSSALNVPVFTIDNYTTSDIYLPYESVATEMVTNQLVTTFVDPQNYVVLGSTDFVDQPVVSVPILGATAASLNFYDNTTDTGGSPPGGPDDLVLGHTNFFGLLTSANIGVTTVFLDATAATTTINDFGAGTFEIGATDATNLNAQSTSHLIMDLPGTLTYVHTGSLTTPTGITVNGSLTGQNLLQGTSGQVQLDDGVNGGTIPHPTAADINYHAASDYVADVYNEVTVPPGTASVGNDTLTGGVGGNGVPNFVGELTGDNYFPEGGIDVVNLAHSVLAGVATGPYSTVWVGFYDVCNNGGPFFGIIGNLLNPDWGVDIGNVLGQAITDITPAGAEVYVDGYGNSYSQTNSLNIFGFVETDTNAPNSGDVVSLHAGDWAVGVLAGGVKLDHGLVDSSGTTIVTTTPAPSVMFNVGFAGETVGPSATVTLDSIGAYANAAQLVTALQTLTTGDMVFLQNGTTAFNTGDVEHVLIAYEKAGGSSSLGGTGQVNIADVTFTAAATIATGATFDTANTAQVTVSAIDLVDIAGTTTTGVNLANLHPNNIWFA